MAVKHVALITTELRPGGAEKCLTDLALGLPRSEWQPHVVSLCAPPPLGRTQLWDQLREAEIPVAFLNVAGVADLPRARAQLKQAWRSHAIHLVQSFLFHANMLSAWVASELAIPCVAGLRVREVSAWRRWWYRRSSSSWDAVVCVSAGVARDAEQRLRIPPSRLIVIPNGCTPGPVSIDQSAVKRQLGLVDGCRYLLFVGRLERQKGIDQLLDSMTTLLNRQSNVDLLILGEGPLRARLQGRMAKQSAARRIHWCGWQAAVRDWITASDVVLIPSRWEGMSNVLLEAMAVGRPVVTTDVEGARDVLGPLHEGQLVPLAEMVAFGNCVQRWLDDPPRAIERGAANRLRIMQEFTPAAMHARYAQLYRQVLQS